MRGYIPYPYLRFEFDRISATTTGMRWFEERFLSSRFSLYLSALWSLEIREIREKEALMDSRLNSKFLILEKSDEGEIRRPDNVRESKASRLICVFVSPQVT